MDDSTNVGDSPYPATYRAPLFWRMTPALLMGPAFLAIGIARTHFGLTSPLFTFMFVIVGFICIVLFALDTGSARVTLFADRLEKRSRFDHSSIAKEDILRIARRGFGLVIFIHKQSFSKSIVITRGIGGDAAWRAWMSSIEGYELFD